MSEQVKILVEAAAKLSEGERLALIGAIQATLQGGDPEWDNAWANEVEKRIADFRASGSKTEDFSKVLADYVAARK
jgi:hypothetical protein